MTCWMRRHRYTGEVKTLGSFGGRHDFNTLTKRRWGHKIFYLQISEMRAECKELWGGGSSDPLHDEQEMESKHHYCKVAVAKVTFAGPPLSGYIKRCPGESKPGTCENFKLRSLSNYPHFGCEQNYHTVKCLGNDWKYSSCFLTKNNHQFPELLLSYKTATLNPLNNNYLFPPTFSPWQPPFYFVSMILLKREGDGRGVQDGEHMKIHGWFMSMYGKNHYSIVK